MKIRIDHKLRRQDLAYAGALATVALACAINLVVPELEQTTPVLFLAAVAVSAWIGGLGPGLVATVLSCVLLDYLFVAEIYSMDLGVAVYASLGVFALVAMLISSLHGSRRRLERVLREQNDRQSEFMAVLAHELRNFLSPMTPAVAAPRMRGDGNRLVEKTCYTIDRQVRSMALLVDDLLDVARIREGKVRLHIEPTDLAAIATQAVQTVRPLIESRGHRLETVLPVRGNPTRRGRSDAAGAGPGQPAHQRGAAHRAWRTALARHGARGSRRGPAGPRQRQGAHPRPALERLRSVRPGGIRRARRARHRSQSGARTGGAPWRPRRGVQSRPRTRQRVRGTAARDPWRPTNERGGTDARLARVARCSVRGGIPRPADRTP